MSENNNEDVNNEFGDFSKMISDVFNEIKSETPPEPVIERQSNVI